MSTIELNATTDQASKPTTAQMPAANTEKVPAVSAETPQPASVPAKAVVKRTVRAPAKKTVAAKQLPAKVTPALADKKAPVVPVKAENKPAKTNPVKATSSATEKAAKLKKPKLVRDSFTIPKAEYLVLEELKQRSIKLASPAKKSELLRAGIKALAAMSDAAFSAAMKAVPTIKTGRPAKP